MLLQINQSEDNLNSILQTENLQENWQVLLLVFILGIVIVWWILKRRKNQRQLSLDIENPQSEYHKYQVYLEAKENSTAEKTKPISIDELPSKISQSVKNENLSKQIAVASATKDTVKNEPAAQYIADKIIALRQTEVNTVVHLPVEEQSTLITIGYDPTKIVIHSGQQTYPYIILPKGNAKVTLPQEGRTGRQGYKDADFRRHLNTVFSNILQVDDNKLVLSKSGVAFSPDISLIDRTDGLNLFIDIEIDEPYEGTNDIENRKAIHYWGCDENRNKAFAETGWMVIRFAEIQVHQNPFECCRYIANLITKISPEFIVPDSLKNFDSIWQTTRWTKEEGQNLSKNKERERYLGIDSFGTVPETKIIYAAKPMGNGKPIENVPNLLSAEMESQPDMPVISTPSNNIYLEYVAEDKSKPTPIIANESPHENVQDTYEITYQTLTIGNQIWMVDNLDVSSYSDGTQIPEVIEEKEWQKFGEDGKGCWCYCDNNPDNCKKEGKLYNWHALNNIKKIAPEGWRIPTKDDFEKLSISFRQMLYMKNNTTDFFGWHYQAERNSDGVFKFFRKGVGNGGCVMGKWWSASQSDSESPNYCSILYSGEKYGHYEYFRIENGNKGVGMAIRCVKDIEHATSKLNQKYSAVNKIIASQKEYESTKIGNQEWMVENLDINHYKDGTPIREAKTNEEWLRYDAEKIGCWSYYNNNSDVGAKYGKLYNWHAVNNKLGLAPKGWHIPTKEEYISLLKYLSPIDTESAIEKLKTTTCWQDGYCGTNESGWSGLGGGYRYSLGAFKLIDETGYWWVDSKVSSALACSFYLPAYIDFDAFYGAFTNKLHGDGCSVRCVKDY